MTDVILHINSNIDRNTLAGDTTTRFTVNLPNPLKVGEGLIKAKVEYIDFPNSIYTFPWHSYKFWYIHNVGTTNNLSSISIDNTRNWNSGSDLAAHLNALMTAAGHNIVFAFNSNTAKLQITNNLANPIAIVSSYRWIQGTDLYSSIDSECTDRLGFTDDYRTATIAAGATLIAPSILRLFRSSCYYLTCSIMNSFVRQTVCPDPSFTPNVIARISAGNFGSVSQLEYSSTLLMDCNSNNGIKTLAFEVLDDELYEVRNNGAPIVFSLRLTFL